MLKKGLNELIFLSALCLLLSGCGDSGWMEIVPRDLAVTSEPAPSASVATMADLEPHSLPSASPSPEQEETHSFLWEDADDFAYSSLNEAEKIWYRDMESILGGFQEEKRLSGEGLEQGLTADRIDTVFQCVLNDHPEMFYVSGYSYTIFSEGDEVVSIAFSGTYNVDFETAIEKEEQIRAAAEPILDGVPAEASEYEKVKYVYETIIRNTDYELMSSDNQNIYSVFVNHSSVCQGYAKAAQYLLNRLGVECTLVLGTVDTGEGHAWNLVKVDGSYYYMDSTWGDASYKQGEGAAAQLAMPEINYDYLNVTTAELLRTHTIGGNVPMPECVAMDANYYVLEGALFESYNREQMAELFARAQEQGKNDVTVKCASQQCYEEVMKALIEDQEIFRYLDDNGDSVAYAQNDKQLSMTFWVTNE